MTGPKRPSQRTPLANRPSAVAATAPSASASSYTAVAKPFSRPRANTAPACALNHALRSTRNSTDLLAVEPVSFVLQPAYARAVGSLGAWHALPPCPLRRMFPNYTDNAAVAAELAGRPDAAAVDRVLFQGDSAPPPLYWSTVWDVMESESPVPRRARQRRSGASSLTTTPLRRTRPGGARDEVGSPRTLNVDALNGSAAEQPEGGGHMTSKSSPERRKLAVDDDDDVGTANTEESGPPVTTSTGSSGHAVRPQHLTAFGAGQAVASSSPRSPKRDLTPRGATPGGTTGPASLPSPFSHPSADYRSRLYREGRAEILRMRQAQMEAKQQEAASNGNMASTATPQPNTGVTLSSTSASKYKEQAETEMLRHLMTQVSNERRRGDEAVDALRARDAELAAAKVRAADSDETIRLLRMQVQRHRDDVERTIDIAQGLDRDKQKLLDEVAVLSRDHDAAVERLKHVHGSSTSATQRLEAELRAANDKVESMVVRLGSAGVEMSTERKAALKAKEEHGRERDRLQRELDTVREQLRKTKAHAEDSAKALLRHQRETLPLIGQLEAQVLASRLMLTAVVQEEEAVRRGRWVERETVVRAQLSGLAFAEHATLFS
jgi:FtsZ-binding cell division protein ZapB